MQNKNEGLTLNLSKYLRRFYKQTDLDQLSNMHSFVMEEVEKKLIALTLEATNNNRLKAAKILGINRNTLLRKIRYYQLESEDDV